MSFDRVCVFGKDEPPISRLEFVGDESHVPITWAHEAPEGTQWVYADVFNNINIEDVIAYLEGLHATLWGRFFDLGQEESRTACAVFLMEEICGILRVAEERRG